MPYTKSIKRTRLNCQACGIDFPVKPNPNYPNWRPKLCLDCYAARRFKPRVTVQVKRSAPISRPDKHLPRPARSERRAPITRRPMADLVKEEAW